MGKWIEDIVEALNSIGGEGKYQDIYSAVEKIRGSSNLSKNWKAVVRSYIEKYSSDSESYNQKKDYFYSVDGIGKGIWGLKNFNYEKVSVDLTEDDIGFPEGKKILKTHIIRERNPKIIREAKKKFIEKNTKLYCEICGFDFEKEYGELGKNFIEGHHCKSISQLKENELTKVEDIAMLCSNCHRMIHRKRPWLTKNELKKLKK